mgnify:FL=1
MTGLTYLASPYTNPDPQVRERRFVEAYRAASALMARGEAVFCPIAHSHPIDLYAPLPQTTEFWMAMDLPVLRRCDRMKVLMLDGWQNSKGIALEMKAAEAMGIPIEFIEAERRLPQPEDVHDDE